MDCVDACVGCLQQALGVVGVTSVNEAVDHISLLYIGIDGWGRMLGVCNMYLSIIQQHASVSARLQCCVYSAGVVGHGHGLQFGCSAVGCCLCGPASSVAEDATGHVCMSRAQRLKVAGYAAACTFTWCHYDIELASLPA